MSDTEPRNRLVINDLRPGGQIAPIIPTDFDQAARLGQAISVSGMAPDSLDTPQKVAIAILTGLEVGLTPMAAVKNIAIVNGRAVIWGDGVLAIVRRSGVMEEFKEWITGEGDKMVAHCRVKRRGEDPVEATFSVDDAKTARLWGKTTKSGSPTPWVTSPKRMLQMRARAFALRDTFTDVLNGMQVREEVEDFEEPINDRPMREVNPRDEGPPPPAPMDDEPPAPSGKPVHDESATRAASDREIAAAAGAVDEPLHTDRKAPKADKKDPPMKPALMDDDEPPTEVDVGAAVDSITAAMRAVEGKTIDDLHDVYLSKTDEIRSLPDAAQDLINQVYQSIEDAITGAGEATGKKEPPRFNIRPGEPIPLPPGRTAGAYRVDCETIILECHAAGVTFDEVVTWWKSPEHKAIVTQIPIQRQLRQEIAEFANRTFGVE